MAHQVATPDTLVEQRISAFQHGDFGFVYDSYHPDAPFLEQFPNRDEYLTYASEEIATACSIERFRVLHVACDEDQGRVIFQQLLKTITGYQESFEMAHLVCSSGRWFYLGSERISRQDFQGKPEALKPDDFARVPNRVFF